MTCHYIDNQLYLENVALNTIADTHGTPTYIYSAAKITQNYLSYKNAFGSRAHDICYAVKANSNIAILHLLKELGAGFDVVSAGELERVLTAGGDIGRTVFAGVGKMQSEIERAIALDISCINIESPAELELIMQVARATGKKARIAVRVNPDVDAKTHPYISTGLNENKFGVPMEEALDVYKNARAMEEIEIVGVSCHIGSQLTEIAPFVAAAERVQVLLNQLKDLGIAIEHIDIGGGLGISYGTQQPPPVGDYIQALCKTLDPAYRIVVEPGRSIVGDAGLLLTRTLFLKNTPAKTFAIVDASMTELIRPALYQAEHPILPVMMQPELDEMIVDVVGPVCETADFLAKDRPLKIAAGKLLAILDAGAYGAVMASSYNSRPRPAEVLVDGDQIHLIRARDTLASLMANEQIPKGLST